MSSKIISLTARAASRIKSMMKNCDDDVLALRIGLERGGCSGMKYKMEYADQQKNSDEVVEQDDIKIFIDRSALLFLIGTTMDYKEDVFASGFEFSNPNQVSACGCGESVMLNRSLASFEQT